MNINQKVTRFALCFGAFVAIGSGLSGLGIMYSLISRLQTTRRGMIQEPGDFSMGGLYELNGKPGRLRVTLQNRLDKEKFSLIM